MAKKTNHPRLQHYVPQFLLRHFTDEKDQLHVFDKLSQRIFTQSPRGIAAEAGFYDFMDDVGKPHTAEYFLGSMEAKVSAIIASVLYKQSLGHLTHDDRVHLSLFAAVQQLRVKAVRQRIQSLNTGILRVLAERGIDPGDVVPQMDDDDVKRQSLAHIPMAKKTAKSYFDKAWVLHRAPEGKPLYISDNPVTLHNLVVPNKLGLNNPGIEIYLPISRSFAICFMCRTTLQLMHQGLEDAAAFERRFGYCPVDSTPIRSLAEAIAAGSPDPLLPENVDHLNSLGCNRNPEKSETLKFL
jgi:hypothetical protein